MIFSLDTALHTVEKELKKIDLNGKPKSLYEPISYILGFGGKRLRPVLTIYSHHIFSDDVKNILKPALAIEVFHNFTLMHDDIMDNAPLRRAKPTVHEKWDNNVAILSGDAMLVKAYQLFDEVEASVYGKVIERFNKTALEVCEGQMLDMDFEKKNDVSVSEYLEMIRLKTSVLLGFSLELGALIAGAEEKIGSKLFQLGMNAGIGFQIKDDLLDLYGSSKKVGKQIGGDIIANKKTYLLVKFLELANEKDRSEALVWLAKKEFDKDAKIEYFRSMFSKYEVDKSAEDLLNQYFSDAMLQLDGLRVDLLRKGKLKKLLVNLIERES